MSRDDGIIEALAAFGTVPVVTLPRPEQVIPLCEALLAAGLPVLEVTFRTEGAAEAIRLAKERFPEMHLGAGTVIKPEQAKTAKEAGARFAVAPGLNMDVVAAAESVGLPFWPGVCTPTEIDEALRHGLTTLKFFPAGAVGGAATVKAMLAPYLGSGVRVIPTGGIDEDSAPAYWALEGVVAVGGSWVAPPKAVAEGDWRSVTERARMALESYRTHCGWLP